jgi:hypothetical protein
VLFERTTRQVRLTAAGEVLLRDTRTALEAVTAAACRAREAGSPSPRLRVALKADVDGGLLPQILDAYCADDAALPPELVLGGFGEQAQALRDGLADVGLLLCPFDGRGLDSEPLLTEPLLAALAAADPLAARTRAVPGRPGRPQASRRICGKPRPARRTSGRPAAAGLEPVRDLQPRRDRQCRVLRACLGGPALPATRDRLPAGQRPPGLHAGPGLAPGRALAGRRRLRARRLHDRSRRVGYDRNKWDCGHARKTTARIALARWKSVRITLARHPDRLAMQTANGASQRLPLVPGWMR